MSIFDINAITETVYKGKTPDAEWVVVPAKECPLQAVKYEARETEGKRVEGTFVFLDITWEVLDDEVRAATNMQHPSANQSFSLDMIQGPDGQPTNQLDFGTNKNMNLLNVWEACGITSNPSIHKILNQTVWGRIEHEQMKDRDNNLMLDNNDKPRIRARVTRVTSLEKARTAQRRKEAAE